MDYAIPAGTLARARKNVFSCVVNGRTVWVKKRRPREHVFFRRVQGLVYAATGLLLALPPELPPRDNVGFETERLRRAAELGLRTPAVLHRTEGYFVLEDAGPDLDAYVKKHPEEREAVIDKAAAELRRMHDLGVVHGGAQIKNMTVRDGEIRFIDFEEGIPDKQFELFKLRDLFLFLFSLEKTGNEPDLRRIAAVYGGPDAERVLRSVVRAVRQLRPLRIFNSRLFSRLGLRDIRPLCRLVDRADREHRRMQGHECSK